MAKNHQTENPLFKALIQQSAADIATAFASLVIYFDNPSSDGRNYQINAMSIR